MGGGAPNAYTSKKPVKQKQFKRKWTKKVPGRLRQVKRVHPKKLREGMKATGWGIDCVN